MIQISTVAAASRAAASRAAAAGFSLLLVGGLAACTESGDTPDAVVEPMTVRVMQFNIEYGGTVVDFASVPAAIEAADADVVALQEAYGRTCKVADAVQWSYCDPRTQVISRFPLITPSDPTGDEVLVLPEEGEAFGVVNLHLPSAPYGPNLVLKGVEDADELVAKEKGRLNAMEPVLDAANRLQDAGVPVVVLGDLNSPSHLDWTAQTEGLRDHVIPVEWPVSSELVEAGYDDAYRVVHPDPVSDPGLTWPAARPKSGSYNPALTGRPADRIDMTFVSRDIAVEDAEILGEPDSEFTDIPIDPWPTDHRAVVTEMEIPLADPGPYVSASTRLVDRGANVEVFGHGADAEEVEVTGTGEPMTVTLDRGVAVLGTGDLAAGENTLELVGADGEPVSTGNLWVREPDAETVVTTSKPTYTRGEPIEVSWTDAPGNKWDWIGVYKRGADPNVAWYKNWLYTESAIAGSATIDDDASGGPWPLPPGKYDVLVLADDSYAELGRAPFTVIPGR
ncbi:MAG TPA: endonuclease/exonuclease/phosphatase family protein [Actinomycetes bacterium]|nr:endonuclease/exonuclease/phosphatase family protein [Actinomycetes bacterium]